MNNVQLVQVLEALVPGARQKNDYELKVDSNGDSSIKLWNPAVGAMPTTEQLTAQLAANQLLQAKTARIGVIAQASTAAQTTGFSSDALGSTHTYPSGLQDQANLTSVVLGSVIPGGPDTLLFWCTDGTSSGFAAHTKTQIQKVGQDALAAIMTVKQKQSTLEGQINAATTVAAVQAIAW